MNKGINQNVNINQNMNMPRESEEFMYPEVYHKIAPHCDQIIKEMENKYGNIYLNNDLLSQMTDEAIHRSGMCEDEMDKMDKADPPGDSMPTILDFGRPGRFDRDHFRRRRFDRDGLSDVARILFLQQIFGRSRPFWRWR